MYPRLQAAGTFALRDVNEVVHEQFAVTPAIGPNDEGMPETNTARVLGDDLGAPRRLRQLRIIGQSNAVDHHHSDPRTILHTGQPRVGSQRNHCPRPSP